MTRFELYRYQILPLDRFFQGDLVSGISSIEELLARKNELFASVVNDLGAFRSGRTETITKKLAAQEDFFLFKIAANRSIHRETKEFTDEYLDNWPSILVGIWNRPEIQLAAIQKRTTAFASTGVVARMIFDTVNHLLESYQLRVHSLPLFERQEFWNIVKKYEGRIQGLEFEFITPNMANISGTLPSDLRDFAKSTNSTTNRLEVKSDADTALHVSEDNPAIQGLVDYSAEGGGNIAVKVSGLKKRKHTARTVREVELEDVEIQAPAEEVINILKQLMG